MREVLLGFDSRITDFDRPAVSDQFKAKYLLREDVDFPKSVDSRIWTSLNGLSNPYSLKQEPGFLTNSCDIAITIIDEANVDILKNLEGIIKMKSPEKEWSFLGFDIADSGFISALSNCGYEMNEKNELVSSWSTCINKDGLLTDFKHALSFRQLADMRVPEHSPFYVFCIYLLAV